MTGERPYCSITTGCVDLRGVELSLPEGIVRCYACQGNGKYRQHYCDAGFLTGECGRCKMAGFMYEHNAEPVPISVTNQIAVANNLEFRGYQAFGLDWRVAA